MNVTLGTVMSWTLIAGAHYQVQVKDSLNAVLVPAHNTGATNSVLIGDLLAGQSGTGFKLSVRSVNPDGTLPSAWSPDVSVTLVGFPVPTGISFT
jgi:hypothetical protein